MNTIASETVDAIRNLRHRDIIIAVATGRQWHSIPPEIKGMDFDYYILSNGAYITDGEGTILHQHEIDAETVEALVNDFLERDYADLKTMEWSNGLQIDWSCAIMKSRNVIDRPLDPKCGSNTANSIGGIGSENYTSFKYKHCPFCRCEW